MHRIYRQIPNLITIARLVLTVLFFALLNAHQSETFARTMWICFGVFLVATLTDILDGYLARSWHVESAFGRVVDPFVDKILVCGAFVFFSSTHFLDPAELRTFDFDPSNPQIPVTSITGVAPWMAVVLIAREFLVTSIRGLAEAKGVAFPADWAGKLKMFIQSFTLGAIMVDVATAFPNGGRHIPWVQITRDIMIYLTVIATVLSATGYILRARRILDD